MKFKLSTTELFYPYKEDREKLEKIGFTFEPYNAPHYFCITTKNPTIDINTTDELVEFVKEYGKIIVDTDGWIEIYNDYRE